MFNAFATVAKLAALPDTAATDFYAGVFYGWVMKDIKADMDLCFPADAEFSKLVDDDMMAIKAQDWDKMNDIVKKMTDKFEADVDACKDNKKIVDVLTQVGKISEDFYAQENWRDVLKKNMDDNKDLINAQNLQMVQAWEAGFYYEAGKFGGMQDQIIFKMP